MPKLLLWFFLSLFSAASLADEVSIQIIAPADGAKLDAMAQTQLSYDVKPGAKGDHTHLYLDDNEIAVLRKLKGTHTLSTLSPGPHEICIKVVNKGHTPIGEEKCIKVTVQ